VYFQALQERLLEIARERIRAGLYTERNLAKLCGLSQPHLHNVLKRVRTPSTTSADRLMEALGLKVQDLLWRGNKDTDFGVEAVPVVRNRIGPGSNAALQLTKGRIPLPKALLRDLVDPVAAHLSPDLILPMSLMANDLILLDQNPALRLSPGPHSPWVVSDGGGLRVRYVRVEKHRLYIVNQINLEQPEQWLSIPLESRNILEIVRARIVWISRVIGDSI
jgi:hypothetical protein